MQADLSVNDCLVNTCSLHVNKNVPLNSFSELLGEPKKRNLQKFLCSQNLTYLSAEFFKTTLNAEIQLVNLSMTTLLSHIRVSKNVHTSEVQTK